MYSTLDDVHVCVCMSVCLCVDGKETDGAVAEPTVPQ